MKSNTSKKVKRPFQHYDLVEVIWDDAAGLKDGWTAKHEKVEPYIALSVGFLLFDGIEHILIAQDTDAEGSHNGRTQIPRGMVKRIKILRKKDGKKTEETTVATATTKLSSQEVPI